MSGATKARNDAVGLAKKQDGHARTLKARIGLLKDELDLLRWKTLTSCHVKSVLRKVIDAKNNINGSVDGLHRGTS